jgi:hypothetical protein
VFKTFSHNYLNLMARLYGKGSIKALPSKEFMYLALSPVIVSGVGASVFTPLASKLLQTLGIGGDDPEEELYKYVEKTLGETASNLARFGAAGLGGKGVSLKGSLAIGITDLPTDLVSLLGAPGSMSQDLYYGGKNIVRGDYTRAAESILPAALKLPIQATREYSQGVTTRTHAPVFYGREPLRPDTTESLIRFLSFNPARVAGIKEQQWKERRIEQKYRDMKTDIYSKIRKYYGMPPGKRSKSKWADILDEISEFNERIKNRKLRRLVSPITYRSIKSNLKRSFRPKKKERLRNK